MGEGKGVFHSNSSQRELCISYRTRIFCPPKTQGCAGGRKRAIRRLSEKCQQSVGLSGGGSCYPLKIDHLVGAQGRNRTTDTRIFSPLLYRLSYLGEARIKAARSSRVKPPHGYAAILDVTDPRTHGDGVTISLPEPVSTGGWACIGYGVPMAHAAWRIVGSWGRNGPMGDRGVDHGGVAGGPAGHVGGRRADKGGGLPYHGGHESAFDQPL